MSAGNERTAPSADVVGAMIRDAKGAILAADAARGQGPAADARP